MNSDLMPSSESANSTSDQAQTQPDLSTQQEPINSTEISTEEKITNRSQPIPPPSEPMQYRAIGLVRGRYTPSAEQITQGQLTATDESELNAVLLGRIMSLVKNHLDLEKEHLWVVYPRTGQEDGKLHLQIVGVWEPENLALQSKEEALTSAEVTEPETEVPTQPSPPNAIQIEDGYFSVRGEVVYQSADSQSLVVKIKQVPRKASEKPKYFKLKLTGVLTTKAVGQFWDFHTKREGENLLIQQGESIAVLPQKPKTWKKKTRSSTPSGRRNSMDAPRPVRKTGEATAAPVVKRKETKAPVAKPIKREKPPQSGS